jgi:hypothetical protein
MTTVRDTKQAESSHTSSSGPRRLLRGRRVDGGLLAVPCHHVVWLECKFEDIGEL